MPIAEQIISIYAVVEGYLDDIPVSNVNRFEEELLSYIDNNHSDLKDDIKRVGKLEDDLEERLISIIEEFKELFEVKEESIVESEEESEESA
jgi:F-type H+-transporting ATPase subunit alpha